MSENRGMFIDFQTARRLAAYRWAQKEMNEKYPDPIKDPDHFILRDLKGRAEKPDSHVALFRGRKDDPVILRVYWNSTDSVKYSYIDNYRDLFEESPDLVQLLERNALYVAQNTTSTARQRAGRRTTFVN